MEYGLKLKYDLVTQIISIVDGSPLYQHSVGVNTLLVDTAVANGCVVTVTFKSGSQSTTALVMTYDSVLKLWKTPIPDIVLANDGSVTISLAVKSPVVTSGGTFYNVLCSGNVNAQVIASVAEKVTNAVPQDQATLLADRINQIDDVVANFKSPTVAVGTTTTVADNAKVTNVGTNVAAILNFEIPRGTQGFQGVKGDKGVSLRLWDSYVETQTYVNNTDFIDLVVVGGTTYAAKIDTVGVVPAVGTNWSVVALKGKDGKDFKIAMVFASVTAMNAQLANYAIGDFVLVNTGNVDDPDTGKLFVRGQTAWDFLTDLSGAQGIQGISINNVALTSSNGLIDIYTIYYTDNTTTNFDVTNGSKIYARLISFANGSYSTPNISTARVGDYVIGQGGQYDGVYGKISSVGATESILSNVISLRGSKWFSAVVTQSGEKYITGSLDGAIVGDFVISSSGQWFVISAILTNTELTLKGDLNGDNFFVRYSTNADGTAFTETWTAGQKYIGIATELKAPTDKVGYTWSLFVGLDGKDGKNGFDGKNGLNGTDGLNGKDGLNGSNGKTIHNAVISFSSGNYTVANIANAVVGDFVVGLSGVYKGYYGIIANIGATVSTLGDVVNLNGADGSGAGNVIATNASVTQGGKYAYSATSKDASGNFSGEFVDVNTLGFLAQTSVVNVRNNEADKVYSAKYVEDTFAPKSFFENLYLTRLTATTAKLALTKPTVGNGNYLFATTTNTAMAWGTAEMTLTRTFESDIQFDNNSAISVVFDVAFNRNVSVEYGAVVKINNAVISSQQAFGLTNFNGDTNFTNVYNNKFDVILDLLLSPTTYTAGDILTIQIFKRQLATTALTTRVFCGVNVNGAERFSFLEYNFTALALNTNQIADGAITLAKINAEAIDKAPTSGSSKLVESGGVFTNLAEKQNSLIFDNVPTQNSQNVVTSGKIYTALNEKQNTLLFDNTPTQNSQNVVTSGGVFTSLATKADTTAIDTALATKANKTTAV
ncbi:MAG: hypothetical protein RRZ69_02900, partial [Clostridia bacterium]